MATGMSHLAMHLQDVIRIFHEPDCGGIITSNDAGELICAECKQTLGQIDPVVLENLIATLDQAFSR